LNRCKRGSFSLRKIFNPGFSNPMELRSPEGVSARRGGRFPSLGSRVTVLVIIPPSSLRSMNLLYSSPYPKVPDAARTGFFKLIRPSLIFKFGFNYSPFEQCPYSLWPFSLNLFYSVVFSDPKIAAKNHSFFGDLLEVNGLIQVVIVNSKVEFSPTVRISKAVHKFDFFPILAYRKLRFPSNYGPL